MDSYFSDLTIHKLTESRKALIEAREFALDAKAPKWMLQNLKKMTSGIQNRIEDILQLRVSRK